MRQSQRSGEARSLIAFALHPDDHKRTGHKRCPVLKGCIRGILPPSERRDQSSVNAMMLLPRLKSIWVLPPAPTTMYCLPSTEYEAGGAFTPAPAKNDNRTLPVCASQAR